VTEKEIETTHLFLRCCGPNCIYCGPCSMVVPRRQNPKTRSPPVAWVRCGRGKRNVWQRQSSSYQLQHCRTSQDRIESSSRRCVRTTFNLRVILHTELTTMAGPRAPTRGRCNLKKDAIKIDFTLAWWWCESLAPLFRMEGSQPRPPIQPVVQVAELITIRKAVRVIKKKKNNKTSMKKKRNKPPWRGLAAKSRITLYRKS